MWRQLKGGLKVDDTQFTCYRFVNSITKSHKNPKAGVVDSVIFLELQPRMLKLREFKHRARNHLARK